MITKMILQSNNFKAEYNVNGETYIMDYAKEINLKTKTSSVIKFLNWSILDGIKKGYKDFKLIIEDDGIFSNTCVPIAALLQYYKNKEDLTFEVVLPLNGYIEHTHMNNPLVAKDYIHSYQINSPFDIVWFFDSDVEVNTLVNNYLLCLRQSEIIADGVIGSIEWCINEVMDNVLQHSGVGCGYIMGQIHQSAKRLSFCIFDYGTGIYNSLKSSSEHHPQTPIDAITMALQEKVTRDTSIGQGNGLWGLSQIITKSNGILKISSNGATYENTNGTIETAKRGGFYLGKSNGTTTVDFQLDYSKDIDITSALTNSSGCAYNSVDLWLENLESDTDENIVNIKISEMSGGTGTRKSAEKVRNMVMNIVNNNKKRINLDFEGINTISSSFADELIGKIIKEKGFVFFTQAFRLTNLTPFLIAIINRSVEQRMAQIYYDKEMTIE